MINGRCQGAAEASGRSLRSHGDGVSGSGCFPADQRQEHLPGDSAPSLEAQAVQGDRQGQGVARSGVFRRYKGQGVRVVGNCSPLCG
jgi:hypothetical protein